MNKYIKPETKVVEVKMESLLADSTLGINASDPAGSENPWDNAAGKNHRTNPLWDQSWEDPEEEGENQ